MPVRDQADVAGAHRRTALLTTREAGRPRPRWTRRGCRRVGPRARRWSSRSRGRPGSALWSAPRRRRSPTRAGRGRARPRPPRARPCAVPAAEVRTGRGRSGSRRGPCKGAGSLLAGWGERDVGGARVLTGPGPLGLTVAQQHQPALGVDKGSGDWTLTRPTLGPGRGAGARRQAGLREWAHEAALPSAQCLCPSGRPVLRQPLCVFEDGSGSRRSRCRAWPGSSTSPRRRSSHDRRRRRADAGVRIFTPNYEMAFAGHPTLGTAHVARDLFGLGDQVRLSMPAGVIPVEAAETRGP